MNIKRQYPWGAHKNHVVENLLAAVVAEINYALIDLAPVRNSPRVSLPRFRQRKHVNLTITVSGKRKTIPLTLGHNALVIGDDDFVPLNGDDGVTNLVTALLRRVEEFWNSHGQ
jgi:hypothetical protein